MLSTHYVPGAPNWVDLGTPDMDRITAFYGALFGWQAESAGPESGGYVLLRLGGKAAAGLAPLTEEGAETAWTVFFHTTDADATTKAVEQAGGTVRVAPMDILDQGRTAGFPDPAGARFAVWQPREHQGLHVVNDPGSLCWAELHTPEPDGARDFYGSVFDWQAQDMPFAGTTYTVLTPADGGEKSSFGGIMPQAPPAGIRAHWLPYFEVADCDATVVKAEELGGSIAVHPVEAPDVGRFARLTDPCGADFAVITSAPSS
jgi:predicted enzyme related to lactoylglutathione lyase